MVIGAKHVDRLLPRHDTAEGLELVWNIREERTGFRRREVVFTHARVRDISLEGALLEVSSSEDHKVGDRVDVRFCGAEGQAIIRHRRDGDDGDVVYGVRFVRDEDFAEALDLTVGHMRGRGAELSRAWHRQN